MWDRNLLRDLARQEADALQDGRIGRLHAAIVRYDGQTLERAADEAELKAELAAALTAVTASELQMLFTVAPKSRVLERLLKERSKPAPVPTAAPGARQDQDEDSEPEQA